jgi:8-oxo-dGTP pyrophosphatase MutT (NUDIX family)
MVYLVRLAFQLMALWSRIIRPVTLGVRIILIQDGEVLLVRHTYMSGWHFPGGALKRYETPAQAAAREAHEEAGVELLEPLRLLGIYSTYYQGKSDHVATYVCRKFRQGRPTDKWEIAECKHFRLGEVPSSLDVVWKRALRDAMADGRA